MYRIGICDDGKNVCADIENMILLYAAQGNIKVEVSVWHSGERLCRYLEQGGHLDILFLDIELFELTGIEVGSFIRNRMEDRGMQIIYISGKASYAQRLFKTQPMDFLVKPILQSQIDEAMELAVKLLEKSMKKFEFQNGREHCYIPYNEILFFTSNRRKIEIRTIHGSQEFYGKIKMLEDTLPREFLAIHKSYIINRTHVARYTYEDVRMDDGTILTISKAHRKQVRESILREN